MAALCSALGVPCVRTTASASWAIDEHVPEHRLREARLDALARVASALGLGGIVTAHTVDDQVETILMRILGGASPTGAAGMRPESTVRTAEGPLRVLRPLLDVSRARLLALLDAAGVEPLMDPTNADPRYQRNLVREDIVPRLRLAFPGFPDTLLRSVDLARLDAEVVDAIADETFERVTRAVGAGLGVDRSAFRALPRAVATRVVMAAARRVAPAMQSDSRELTTERISAVLDAAQGRSGAVIQLPYGVDVRIERDVLLFAARVAGAE